MSNEEIAERLLILADNADAFSPNETNAQKARDEKTDDFMLARRSFGHSGRKTASLVRQICGKFRSGFENIG